MFNFTKSQTEADLKRAEAKLNLRITDFKRQRTVTIGAIVALIDRLPAYHLTKLKEITYDPQQLTIKNPEQPIDRQIQGVKGVYLQHRRMVSIFDTSDTAVFKHTLFHEIGHHVYFTVIGQALKHIWVTEVCRQDGFVTDYAELNAAEDFAESYVSYLLSAKELKTIPIKYNFMHEFVFKHKEPGSKPEKLNLLA